MTGPKSEPPIPMLTCVTLPGPAPDGLGELLHVGEHGGDFIDSTFLDFEVVEITQRDVKYGTVFQKCLCALRRNILSRGSRTSASFARDRSESKIGWVISSFSNPFCPLVLDKIYDVDMCIPHYLHHTLSKLDYPDSHYGTHCSTFRGNQTSRFWRRLTAENVETVGDLQCSTGKSVESTSFNVNHHISLDWWCTIEIYHPGYT
ncbi:hypothetical protein BU15DRAFT_61443 [Melanogaster broomeanus]|nr:hypothetical protein BU15DRAFT_61443 [Melanogaster broomeanus]